MATEATIFLDSTLGVDDLPSVPTRLLAECPRFMRYFEDWGWPPDPDRFEWTTHPSEAHSGLPDAADRWADRKTVTLFGPGGHLKFGPGWVEWSTEVKWSWLFDPDPHFRTDLTEGASQLAKVIGCRDSVALVVADCGDDGDVEDLLMDGDDVRAAMGRLADQGRKPVPLARGDALGKTPSWLFTVKLT